MRTRRLVRLPTILLLMAPVACGRSDTVANDDEAPRWRLGSEPLVVIGGHDERSTHSLSKVRGALLLPDGRIAVGDTETREIRFFSSAGEHLATVGGRGAGPGEFGSLGTIHHGPGGGVCAWDVGPKLVTCFPAELDTPATVEVELDHLWDFRPSLVGFFEDGSFVLYQDHNPPFEMRDLPSGERRDTVEFTRFGADGRQIDTLARLPGNETIFRNEEGIWGYSDILFGRRIFGTLDRVFAVGVNDSVDVHLLDPMGAELGRVAEASSLERVTEGEVDSIRAGLLRELEGEEASRSFITDASSTARLARQQRLAITERPYRPTKPAFDRLHISHDTLIWIAEPLAMDSTIRDWVVIDRQGRTVARIEIPADTDILDLEADRVLLLTRDELDVESVVMMALEKG